MGMSKAQLFLRVELPLALPVVVAGFRTATVQAIGNIAVAALIGAGGMGIFIFQGLGQFAMDMVLMGTLPVIAMALVADAVLGFVARATTPRGLLSRRSRREPPRDPLRRRGQELRSREGRQGARPRDRGEVSSACSSGPRAPASRRCCA